jgi:hypothetical protein
MVGGGGQPADRQLVQADVAGQHPQGRHLHLQRGGGQALPTTAAAGLPVVPPGQQDLKGEVLEVGIAAQAVGQPGDEPAVDGGVVVAGLGAAAAVGGQGGRAGQRHSPAAGR